MKFLVFYEKAPGNYCALVPNLPVICFSTGGTVEEIRSNIREAMDGHLELMLLDGDPIDEPTLCYAELEVRHRDGELSAKYNVVYETSPTNNVAYCPDLTGCWAAGPTLEEARDELSQVIRVRLGEPAPEDLILPDPEGWGELVDVPLPVPADGIPAAGS